MTANDIDRLSRERSARELSLLADQIERTGGCEHPVRLQATGPGSPTRDQPDGVLLVACKQRRETRCKPCSVTYRGDAKQIVRAGIEGGKGGARDRLGPPVDLPHPDGALLRCGPPGWGPLPLAPPGRCEHGRRLHCVSHHDESDEVVGSPLCTDCYDYEAAVVFNATVGELWRRVTIYARRHLAYVLGMTEREIASEVRLSYVKVAELQRRGVVHLHAVVRADGIDEEEAVISPPGYVTPQLLTEALVNAARAVSVTREIEGRRFRCCFGEQVRSEHLDPSGMARLAGYLSKYLVKEASGNGALDHRLREGEIELLDVPEHLRRILETAWRIGADPEEIGFRRWAHALGFTGHVMTKSRRYSTTFLALRKIRLAWRLAEHESAPEAPDDTTWVFTGAGHSKGIDAVLASTCRAGRSRARGEFWSSWHETREAVA